MKTMIPLVVVAALLSGCETVQYDPHVAAVENQLRSRSLQTRELEAPSRSALISAVIGTLQDHHFRIEHVDPVLGTVSAYQRHGRSNAHTRGSTALTVMIREVEGDRFRVRMSMSVDLQSAETPELYQQFFAALQNRLHARTSA